MAITYFPFDAGTGASVTEAQWGQMAQLFLKTGIVQGQLNQFNVYADSTGMQVKVDTGIAWIQGFYCKSDSLVIKPIATAPTSNSRIDRVVLQVDWTNNNISIVVVTGAVAASPAEPALTQNSSIWQIPLASVTVGTNAATIAAGNVTDERYFAGNLNYVNAKNDIIWNTITTQNGWIFYGGVGSSYAPQAYWKDQAGTVHVKGIIAAGATATGTVLFNLPAGYRPKEQRYFGGWDGANVWQRLSLLPNGNMTIDNINQAPLSNTYLILDNIQFPAEQ